MSQRQVLVHSLPTGVLQDMAFIKVANVVINTSYIAAVRFEGQNSEGEESVSLLVAVPTLPLFQQETANSHPAHYEWLEFTGRAAIALKDYFTSFNHVTDLTPAYPSMQFSCKSSK